MTISFQYVRTRAKVEGFSCHHLIPRQVIEARAFARFFGNLRSEGFDPDDFISNGMYLPSTERLAQTFKLPLHRGPHPKYNEFVASHIAELVSLKRNEAAKQISLLQSHLRVSLRTLGNRDIALSRSPMSHILADELDSIGRLAVVRGSIPRLP